jgi:hypothetical protein
MLTESETLHVNKVREQHRAMLSATDVIGGWIGRELNDEEKAFIRKGFMMGAHYAETGRLGTVHELEHDA